MFSCRSALWDDSIFWFRFYLQFAAWTWPFSWLKHPTPGFRKISFWTLRFLEVDLGVGGKNTEWIYYGGGVRVAPVKDGNTLTSHRELIPNRTEI